MHFARQFRRMIAQYQAGESRLDDIILRTRGWVNHVRYANTTGGA